MAVKYCPSCGTTNSVDAMRCMRCGTMLPQMQQPYQQQYQPQMHPAPIYQQQAPSQQYSQSIKPEALSSPPKSGRTKIIVVIVAVIIIVISASIAWSMLANPFGASVLAAPNSLVATPGNNNVSLSWQAPSSNGGSSITNYRIYRGIGTGGETYLTKIGNLTSYVDSAVTNEVTYNYQISAFNGVRESPMSNKASAVPSLPPITGINVSIISGPTYQPYPLGDMMVKILVTNERTTDLEIYNDTYVATLSDGSKLDGYYEGNPNIEIGPGGSDSFVIKFYCDGWADIVSIRFADESGYVDIPVP